MVLPIMRLNQSSETAKINMTGQIPARAELWELKAGKTSDQPLFTWSADTEITLGRDRDCQIFLDSQIYTGVSRHHALIRSTVNQGNQQAIWLICDLNSANGTYINAKRIQGCEPLQTGDRITLAVNGPEFIFQCQTVSSAPQFPSDSLTLTQLFPIFATGGELSRKAYLIPGMLTVLFVVLMFVSIGKAGLFNLVLAAYLAGAAYYFVYQLCGKHKPWWVIGGCGCTMLLILHSPILNIFIFFFRKLLPGKVEVPPTDFLDLLVKMFFGAGLMEELLKALPVLGAWFLGRCLKSPGREQIGVWEPLDGILLGTASAVAFTLMETLGQYVPQAIHTGTLGVGIINGELLGLQLLIPRILGSVAGHMAYSGYLGYFIGLSVLKPKHRWQILVIGYLTAAGLHALWNATGNYNVLVLALVGVLSYAFLGAAILKARVLSPTRSQNFATRISN